jgi:hypothetical protein
MTVAKILCGVCRDAPEPHVCDACGNGLVPRDERRVPFHGPSDPATVERTRRLRGPSERDRPAHVRDDDCAMGSCGFPGCYEATFGKASERDPAVEAAGNAIAAQSFTEPHRLAEIALRVAGDPALGPHALVRLGDVLAPVDAAIEELEAGFAAQWPSGKRPPVHDDGWMHFGSALDHLRDVRRDYEGRL